MSILAFIAGGAATGALFGALAVKRRRARFDEGEDEDEDEDDTQEEGDDDLDLADAEEARRQPPRPKVEQGTVLSPEVVRPKPLGVAFAEGIARPVWPLQTRHPRRGVVSYRGVDGKVRGNWARRFGAHRNGSKGARSRNHAGIDLFAHAGDPVLAMAAGRITAVQSFHLGSWAVFVEHAGVVVMYGEVEARSWKGLGVSVGSVVEAGQPIAKVACMVRGEDGRCVSHMLHLETYAPGTTRNQRWYAGEDAPPALRDPTLLLLRAAQEASTPAVA